MYEAFLTALWMAMLLLFWVASPDDDDEDDDPYLPDLGVVD